MEYLFGVAAAIIFLKNKNQAFELPPGWLIYSTRAPRWALKKLANLALYCKLIFLQHFIDLTYCLSTIFPNARATNVFIGEDANLVRFQDENIFTSQDTESHKPYWLIVWMKSIIGSPRLFFLLGSSIVKAGTHLL